MFSSCSIIGTPFYLMRYVPGVVFKSPSLFELSAGERGGYYSALCQVLATIHSVDIAWGDLEDFGKRGRFGSQRFSTRDSMRTSADVHNVTFLVPNGSNFQNFPPTSLTRGDLGTIFFAESAPCLSSRLKSAV